MANEAVLVYELQPPIPFTVDNAVGVEKGELLQLIDPMTVSGAGTIATGDVVGGIAASEKIAGDGKTKLGVYRKGIFKVCVSGGCIAGAALKLCGDTANHVTQVNSAVSGSVIIGTALEAAAAAATADTILMELNPMATALS